MFGTSHPKFIVYRDEYGEIEVTLGNVELHKDLRPFKEAKILGGGWFKINNRAEPKQLFLYNKSYDFGDYNHERVLEAVKNNSLFSMEFEEYEIYCNHDTEFSKDLNDYECIHKPEPTKDEKKA